MRDKNMVKEEVDVDDVLDCDGCGILLNDLIARLMRALDMVPDEFRDTARVEIYAYDWDGSAVTFERPMTRAETEAVAARIERERQDNEVRRNEEWLRNVRMYGGVADRDEALEFIRTCPIANDYHPDVFKKTVRHNY